MTTLHSIDEQVSAGNEAWQRFEVDEFGLRKPIAKLVAVPAAEQEAPLDAATAQEQLAQMFPEVDCGHIPLGTRVIVQIRGVLKKQGDIILVEETKETTKWNTQVAKVIALGSLAYKNRATHETWPEGEWAQPGDYVRVPRWGGDRWEVPVPGRDKDDPALFVTFNDHELISRVTGDPLAVRAFIL